MTIGSGRRETEMKIALRRFAILSMIAILTMLVPTGAALARIGTVATASLNGEREVPGPGDPNGVGQARIRLLPGMHRVCFDLHWAKIRRPFAAHIHKGVAGVAGPVKVALFVSKVPLPGSVHGVSGCVGHVNPDLINRIKNHPRRFYVNIHNNRYPNGAIRGQLHIAA